LNTKTGLNIKYENCGPLLVLDVETDIELKTLSMGRCYNHVNGRVEFEGGWLIKSILMA